LRAGAPEARLSGAQVNEELTSGLNSTNKDQAPTGRPAKQQRQAPGMTATLPATDSQ
jgi:hypothetical protein